MFFSRTLRLRPRCGAINNPSCTSSCTTSCFFFSSRRRHTRFDCDWSSDVCSSDLFDANYTYSKDYDDDSNERDPFTFRYANLFNLASEYSYSDRDERHKFNFYTVDRKSVV